MHIYLEKVMTFSYEILDINWSSQYNKGSSQHITCGWHKWNNIILLSTYQRLSISENLNEYA